MAGLILFLLYATLSSNVYALVPVIIILIFILAAAGLTRGVSIFNLFGIGALMGIGGGVGKGGAGKGLKAASAVKRNKMKATIAKSPRGLPNLAKRLGVRQKTTHLQKKQAIYIEKIGKNIKAKNAKKVTKYVKKAIKIEKKLDKITGGKINLATTLAAPKKPLSNKQIMYRNIGLNSNEFQSALKDYKNKSNIKVDRWFVKGGTRDIILGEVLYQTRLERAKQAIKSAKPPGKPQDNSPESRMKYFEERSKFFEKMANSRTATALEIGGIFSAISVYYTARQIYLNSKVSNKSSEETNYNLPPPVGGKDPVIERENEIKNETKRLNNIKIDIENKKLSYSQLIQLGKNYKKKFHK